MSDEHMSKKESEWKQSVCRRFYPLILAESKRLNESEEEKKARCLDVFENISDMPWIDFSEETIEEIKKHCTKRIKELSDRGILLDESPDLQIANHREV